MANPNLLTATAIYGNLFSNSITSTGAVTTIATFSNPAGSNKIFNIKNILIQGGSSSSASNFSVEYQGLKLYSFTGSTQLTVTSLINKNTQIYLQENQSIVFAVYSPNASPTGLNYLISYEEIS
jgi:hypothetical protein